MDITFSDLMNEAYRRAQRAKMHDAQPAPIEIPHWMWPAFETATLADPEIKWLLLANTCGRLGPRGFNLDGVEVYGVKIKRAEKWEPRPRARFPAFDIRSQW